MCFDCCCGPEHRNIEMSTNNNNFSTTSTNWTSTGQVINIKHMERN